jgi:hypothetical protein
MPEADNTVSQPLVRRKHGDVREDGMIFVCYQNKGGEYWVSPERWEIRRAKQKARKPDYLLKNKERLAEENPERVIELKKKWRAENKEKSIRQANEWRKANPEKALESECRKYAKHKEAILARNKEYRQRNKDAINAQKREYIKKRRQEHAPYAIQMRLRARFAVAVNRKRLSKKSSMYSIVGCSWEELKAYLESKFLPGMSWDNRSLWEIDHIIPCATAKTEEETEKLFHFSNLQPLWRSDNLKKGAKLLNAHIDCESP